MQAEKNDALSTGNFSSENHGANCTNSKTMHEYLIPYGLLYYSYSISIKRLFTIVSVIQEDAVFS